MSLPDGLSVRPTSDDGKSSSAGEYFIDALTFVNYKGEGIDLVNIFEEINIFEDIWKNFITGNILIKDANNLFRNFPIIGQEYLRMKIGSKPHSGKALELIFRIHGTSEVGQSKEGVVVYSLNFCSPEMERDQYSKIPHTYKGTAEEIVGDILGESGNRESDKLGIDKDRKYLNWEFSNGTEIVISPSNKSPVETINMVAAKTVADDDKGCTFVFFESITGSFNFLCVENLVKQKPSTTYILRQADVWKQDEDKQRNLELDSVRIEEFVVQRPMNVMQARLSGMLGSRSMIIDISKRKVDTYEYDYFEDFVERKENKLEGLSSFPTYFPVADLQTEKLPNEYKNARFNVSFDSSYVHNNNTGFDTRKTVPRRSAILNQYSTIKVNIKVAGNLYRKVGEVVNLIIPSVASDEIDGNRKDTKLSGKYLVTAIRHSFSQKEYKMRMELAKDSFNMEFFDEQ